MSALRSWICPTATGHIDAIVDSTIRWVSDHVGCGIHHAAVSSEFSQASDDFPRERCERDTALCLVLIDLDQRAQIHIGKLPRICRLVLAHVCTNSWRVAIRLCRVSMCLR